MLSLRVVISAIAALSVATVAAITLSITLTSSLAALRSVGTGQAEALLRAAQLSSEALFAVPQDAAETLQNKSRARAWANPSTSAAVRSEWLSTMDTLNLQAGGRLSNLQLYFADNTYGYSASIHPIGTSRADGPAPFTAYTMVYGTPITNTSDLASIANQTAVDYVAFLNHADNRTALPRTDPRFDMIAPPLSFSNIVADGGWETTLMFVTGGGRRNVNAGVFSAFTGSRVDTFYVFMAPMYRQAEIVGATRPYGVTVASLRFDDLNAFLRATKATPGTLAVAYDRLGFMLASSADEPATTTDEVPFGAVASTGCTTTEATQTTLATTVNYRVCRRRAAGYGGYAALSAALAVPDLAFAADRRVQLLRTDDGVYFAGAAQVPIRFRGTSVHLLVLMPEVDVIGDVVRSRNVAIGVTCAAFVIVAALTFAAITLLLAPLGTIAERMQRAADFDDDGADESVSAMSEVAALQRAYYEMNDELNRIRSFVPQSVLVAKRRQRAYAVDHDDDDDDEGELTADGRSIGRSDSGRSRRSARSGRSTGSGSGSRTRRASANSAGAAAVVSYDVPPDLIPALLTPKSVAVLVANAAGFTVFAGGSATAANAHRTADAIAALLAAAELAIGVNGGVLGGFHGDHFTATFNAVRPCSAPARRACAAASELMRSGDSQDPPSSGASPSPHPPFQMGIAASRCLVGNAGTSTAKTFAVVGPAFPQALFLERLSRLYGPDCRALTTARVCSDVSSQFRYRYVDHVVVPPRQTTLVAALLGPILEDGDEAEAGALPGKAPKDDGNDDEWLYVLEAQAANDPNGRHNAAFESLSNGRLSECAAYIDELKELTKSTNSTADDDERRLPVPMPDVHGFARTEEPGDADYANEQADAKPSDPAAANLLALAAAYGERSGGTGPTPTSALTRFHQAYLRATKE